jgi:hypothetical protein
MNKSMTGFVAVAGEVIDNLLANKVGRVLVEYGLDIITCRRQDMNFELVVDATNSVRIYKISVSG